MFFFSIAAHQDGLERREQPPGGVQQRNVMVWYRRVIHVETLIFDDEGDENIFTSIWAIFKVEYQVKTLWPAHY